METEVKIELKYCERCGGLWLRRVGNTEIYCVTCAPEMSVVARPRRVPGPSRSEGPECMPDLGGVACA